MKKKRDQNYYQIEIQFRLGYGLFNYLIFDRFCFFSMPNNKYEANFIFSNRIFTLCFSKGRCIRLY